MKNSEYLRDDKDEFRRLLMETGLFDASWYLQNNDDVRAALQDPLEHFIQYGMIEGRDPGPNFDTAYYREKNLFGSDKNATAIEHYLLFGRMQNLPTSKLQSRNEFRHLLVESGLFDAEWYLRNNDDVRTALVDPLEHFLASGAYECRDPGPEFETTYYMEQVPACKFNGTSPLEYYLRHRNFSETRGNEFSPYQRWRRRFELLNDSDRHLIAASSLNLPLYEFVHYNFISDQDSIEMPTNQIWNKYISKTVRRSNDCASITEEIRKKACCSNTVIILSYGSIILKPHALYTFASMISSNKHTSTWYSDHDYYDDSGSVSNPIFKPAFSSHLMQTQHYIGPVIAIKLNGSNVDPTLALIHEIAACTDVKLIPSIVSGRLATQQLGHIPMILYSISKEDAPYVYPFLKGHYEPIPSNKPEEFQNVESYLTSVSIIIPTRDSYHLLRSCIESILSSTDFPHNLLDIIIVDNGSTSDDAVDYLNALEERGDAIIVRSPGSFNFSALCNAGAEYSKSDILLFLNNDMTVIDPNWLKYIVSFANSPDTGAVGGQLLYPDDTIQHGGIILGLQGTAGHRLVGAAKTTAERIDATRETIAVTGACLAVRRSIFVQVSGFDVNLGISFNDVEFCIRLHAIGLKNYYIATPLLYHYESKSRGFDVTKEKEERCLREAIYTRRKFPILFKRDPFYNPNLSLQRAGTLAWPPRVVRPWRLPPGHKKIIILANNHQKAHEVSCVVALQADFLSRNGWEVAIGGPMSECDRKYPSCTRVELADTMDAAVHIANDGYSCVIVHTYPFFAIVRVLGESPPVYFYDHGEPPAEFFRDQAHRADIDWQKRFCAPLAKRVYVISEAVFNQQFEPNAIVLRNGNSHSSIWSDIWASRRADLRTKYGFDGRKVILNVLNFCGDDLFYKGLDDYIGLARELPYVSTSPRNYLLALVCRGDQDEVEYASEAGIVIFSNVSEAEVSELYAASDLYVNLSRWERYNSGIGQALAMGLDVVASDIPAHREFGVAVSNSIPDLSRIIDNICYGNNSGIPERKAKVDDWAAPLIEMLRDLTTDLSL